MPIKKGRFYFKLTSNGNLLGEYSNEGMQFSGTESAVRMQTHPDTQDLSYSFPGKYLTCWLEGTKPHAALLEIKHKYLSSTKSNLFILNWTNKSGSATKFVGEGMLCDDMLIGCYE